MTYFVIGFVHRNVQNTYFLTFLRKIEILTQIKMDMTSEVSRCGSKSYSDIGEVFAARLYILIYPILMLVTIWTL